MNFDSLKEQILDRLGTIWGQIRETSIYINLSAKYEELTPSMQKLVNAGGVLAALLIVFSIPLSYLSTSSDNVTLFEEYRDTLRELLNVQREIAQAPDVPQAPPTEQVKGRIQQILTEAGLGPEQIREVKDADTAGDPPTSTIPNVVKQNGVVATLLKLNLKQVLDIGFQMQNIGPNLYLTSMDMTASKDDPHYYDVIYRVVGFAVEEAPAAPEDGAAAPNKKGPPPPPPPGGKNK